MDGHAERCASFTPVRKPPKAAHQRLFAYTNQPWEFRRLWVRGPSQTLIRRGPGSRKGHWEAYGNWASGWHPAGSGQRKAKAVRDVLAEELAGLYPAFA